MPFFKFYDMFYIHWKQIVLTLCILVKLVHIVDLHVYIFHGLEIIHLCILEDRTKFHTKSWPCTIIWFSTPWGYFRALPTSYTNAHYTRKMLPTIHQSNRTVYSTRRFLAEMAPDSKVHGANMGPIRGRQEPGGPHVGPMNLAIWGLM